MRQADLSLSLMEIAKRAEFQVVDDTDHLTSVTGLSLSTVKVRYPGNATWDTVTATETGYGWYRPSITSAAQTVGNLLVHLSASTGYDPVDLGLAIDSRAIDATIGGTGKTLGEVEEATYYNAKNASAQLYGRGLLAIWGLDTGTFPTGCSITYDADMEVGCHVSVRGVKWRGGDADGGISPTTMLASIDMTVGGLVIELHTTTESDFQAIELSRSGGNFGAGTMTFTGFRAGYPDPIVVRLPALEDNGEVINMFPRVDGSFGGYMISPANHDFIAAPAVGSDGSSINPTMVTVRDQFAAPLIGAQMGITDEATGTVFLASYITDASGKMNVQGLTPGVYRAIGMLAGYSIPATNFTVAEGGGSAIITATKNVITAPSTPGMCTLYGYLADVGLVAQSGIKVTVGIASITDESIGGKQLSFKPLTTATNAAGYWAVDVPTSVPIHVLCKVAEFDKTITIADGTTTKDWTDI